MIRPNVSRAAAKVARTYPDHRERIATAAASKNEAEFAFWCLAQGFDVPWATLKGEPDAKG